MNNLVKYGINERFKTEATLYPEYEIARVIAQYKGLYKIVTNSAELQAEISGKLRYNADMLEKYPTVGDFVMVSHENEDSHATIHHVLTRKSVFVRKAVGVNGQSQPVASNIDTVFICMSLNNNFNLSRIERYLGIAWDSGATPVIVLTKSDLCDDLSEKIFEVERVSSFSDVIAISMYDEDINSKFEKYLQCGKTCAFIGSSGVGKSTLVNGLMGETVLLTQDIGRGDKGRHTTTGREMFVSPFGGVLIDTPGMRELGAESVDLSKTFDDIEALAENCKFSDCTHTSEPNCAVLEAIINGELEQRRYDSYIKLKTEVGYQGLTSKQIEEKKYERFGGVKSLRKIGDTYRKIKYGGG